MVYCQNTQSTKSRKEVITVVKLKMDQLANQLQSEFPDDARVRRMCERYRDTKFVESKDHETYTVNKGQSVHMCVRDYSNDTKPLHTDINLLTFVALHELAHIMSVTTHHTEEFWSNFKFLLKQATKYGIYTAIDYSYHPQQYCKMQIYDNPLFYERTMKDMNNELIEIISNQN